MNMTTLAEAVEAQKTDLFTVTLHGRLDFSKCRDRQLRELLRHFVARKVGSHREAGMEFKYALDDVVDAVASMDDHFESCDEVKSSGRWPALTSIVEQHLKQQREALMEKVASGQIEVEDAAVYFEKGMEVAFHRDGLLCGGVIESVTLDHTFFGPILRFQIMVVHGLFKTPTLAPTKFAMPGWDGLAKIASLPVHPISADEKQELTERGAIFARCVGGAAYVRYMGAMQRVSWSGDQEFRADGRVMIDSASFQQIDPEQHRQMVWDMRCDKDASDDKFELTPADYWRTSPHLYGFSFAAKMWGRFRVENLTPIKWAEDAFEKLVLPKREKELVKSLVEHSAGSFSDIVDGKGGGCIFLLHGPPGQGKTLTAETVAEQLKRPLYSVSVGELGTDPDVLEKRLSRILDVATTWNAVLLLDEADIFLEARNESDILRNAMVGVFLRLLEYHQGVLFLTTNRVRNIDNAFYSRISVALGFEEATAEKRKQIWDNLLSAAKLEGLDTETLSSHNLNGRQIKNVIRLSQTLSKADGKPVDMAIVNEVVGLTTAFNVARGG